MGTYVKGIHIQTRSVYMYGYKGNTCIYLSHHYLVNIQTYLNRIFFSNSSETLQKLESMRTAPVIHYHLDLMKWYFNQIKKIQQREKYIFFFKNGGVPPKNILYVYTVPVYGIFIQVSSNPVNKIYTSKLICCLITGCTKYLIVVLIPAIPIRALRIFVRGRLGIVSVTPLTQRAYKTRWQTAVTQIQSEGFWEMTWTTCSKICCLISFLLSKRSLSILL